MKKIVPVVEQAAQKSPFYVETMKAGVKAFTLLNRMFMPKVYGDPVDEYWSIVNGVTLWDVSPEFQIEVSGPDATKLVDQLVPRDLSKFNIGQCRYVVLLDQEGKILNDPVLARLEEDRYWFSASDSDLMLWIKGVTSGGGYNVTLDIPDVAPIQVQGARSMDVMRTLFGEEILNLKYYHLWKTTLDNIPVVVTRTGWSGDLGYEIYLCDVKRATELWRRVLDAGKPHEIRVCGPNTIRRVEAGILALHSDFTMDDNPFEAGFDRLIDIEKSSGFIGQKALRQIQAKGISKKLVGVQLDRLPTQGIILEDASSRGLNAFKDTQPIGLLTNAVYSPRLDQNIGFASVDIQYADIGQDFKIQFSDELIRAEVVNMPFFDPKKEIARKNIDAI